MSSNVLVADEWLQYFPKLIGEYISTIINEYQVAFRLSKPRKTKLGDFKVDSRTGYS